MADPVPALSVLTAAQSAYPLPVREISLLEVGPELARLTRENEGLRARLVAKQNEWDRERWRMQGESARESDRHITEEARLRAEIRDLRRRLVTIEVEAGHAREAAEHYKRIHGSAVERGKESAKQEIERLHLRVGELSAENTSLREQMADILESDAVGETCDECGGSGEVSDEIPDEFGVQIHYGECSCFGGRVAR